VHKKYIHNIYAEDVSAIMMADLIRMYDWSRDWQMLFKVEKCIVMHMGKGNGKYKQAYNMEE